MAGKPEPSRAVPDTVASLLRLPLSTAEFIDQVARAGVNQAGRRTLYLLISSWDVAGVGPFAASTVAATGLSRTIDIVQMLFVGPVFHPLLSALGVDRVKLRASLCTSALIGLGVMRYAVRSEPLHSMDVNALVDAYAPTLQRYLVGDIS